MGVDWDQEGFGNAYEAEFDYLRQVEKLLKSLLARVMHDLDDPKLVRARVDEFRIKERGSLARKAQCHGWASADALWLADDLIGARAVCNNTEDVYRFQSLLEEKLPTTDVDVQDYIACPGETGYRAVHLNFRLAVISDHPGDILGKQVGCEVQIRSLLQDAWARLSHADIYKGEDLSPDLLGRMTDLSDLLVAADRIASRVRGRVTQLRTADDGQSVDSKLVRFYGEAFGKLPSDYVIREAREIARHLSEQELSEILSMLRDSSFKHRVDAIYREAFGLRAGLSDRFVTAVRAVASSEDDALRHLQAIVDAEASEIDDMWRRKALSEMPETLEDFMDLVSQSPDSIIPLADALSATGNCSVCGEVFVDPEALEESVAEYYEVDEAPGLAAAVTHSGLQVPDMGNPNLCMYHGETFRKD